VKLVTEIKTRECAKAAEILHKQHCLPSITSCLHSVTNVGNISQSSRAMIAALNKLDPLKVFTINNNNNDEYWND